MNLGPIRLGVNIDHVATVRQARRGIEPGPVTAAVLALLGGADGITVHLREDRRHIQDRDVRALKPFVPRLNLEMAVADEIVAIACEVQPHEATLVPEKREELTTEGGLDVVANEKPVAKAVERLLKAGITVSLFIDPDIQQIDVSKALGAQAVEIQTARYSEAKSPGEVARELDALKTAAAHARDRGLAVHAGHGLNYDNVQAVARIPGMQELNIGHSIVSRAVLVGMERAVREMKEAMRV
jgi:pyridoxine 5-phosphate synthase